MNKDAVQSQNTSIITSSRAAQLSGYSQDYVGQLCRNGSIGCKRVSGEWQVDLSDLLAYKKRFNPNFNYTSTTVATNHNSAQSSPITSVTLGHKDVFTKDDKTYISSAEAADITGYSQDYVGQLARSDSVKAQKVGRKWFVDKSSLMSHKAHNDGLLATIQTESVGLSDTFKPNTLNSDKNNRSIPIVTYERDDGPIPLAVEKDYNHVKVMDLRQKNIIHNDRDNTVIKAQLPIQAPELATVSSRQSRRQSSLSLFIVLSIIGASIFVIFLAFFMPNVLRHYVSNIVQSSSNYTGLTSVEMIEVDDNKSLKFMLNILSRSDYYTKVNK